ncbi:hypothetical protein [Marinoscillum sp. MHG1-6]|uniref:hypothetical protein n=1 Tax=Marinoscillum sp. MHG1-6 TaxID=2959627 RepID=UPI002157F2E8|nr:hypothetical protein [Marinoscillum sp. MHG1-6]
MIAQARGNDEFKVTFSTLCLKNYREFVNNAEAAFLRSDEALFKRSVHKIQALNKLFHCKEFQIFLSDLSANTNKFFGHLEKLKQIKSYSELIMVELGNIK